MRLVPLSLREWKRVEPLKDENGNYQIEEETYLGYGCCEFARIAGSTEFRTFINPITSDTIAGILEELEVPFYDPTKSFVAVWDSDKKQVYCWGSRKYSR